MKIVHLFRGNGGGGDAAVAFALQREYVEAGHDSKLYVRCAYPELVAERAAKFGVAYELVDDWSGVPTEELRGADAVHLHTPGEYLDFAQNVRPFKGRVARERLFCTVHGPRPVGETIVSLRQTIAATLAARSVNRIVVPAQHKVREWAKRMPHVRNVVRIGNPVRALELSDRAAARERLGIPADATVAAFVGLFRPEKGAMTILEAARGFRPDEVHFAFAGSGPEEEACRGYALEHGIDASFHGYLSDPGILLAAADVFLFPSFYENFPISLMQAVAAGLPTVSSRIPVAVDELAQADSVALFEPRDAEGLARGLRELLARGDAREGAARFGEAVAAHYAPAAIAEGYLGLFRG